MGILAACMPVREVNALYKGIVTGRAIAILILVAAFCVSTFIVVGMISKALLGVVGNLDQIAEGKLNFKVPDKLLNRSDEVGKSARAVYSVVNGFSGIIRDIHNSMLDMNEFTGTFTSNFDSIGQSISSVNTAVNEIAQGATTQAADTQKVSESMNEMSNALGRTADSVNAFEQQCCQHEGEQCYRGQHPEGTVGDQLAYTAVGGSGAGADQYHQRVRTGDSGRLPISSQVLRTRPTCCH